MFWWIGNIIMALWASVTVVAGLRYADGKAVEKYHLGIKI